MNRKHYFSRRSSLALAAAAALLLAGCGGGGSGGGTAGLAPVGQGTISGTVVKGPVHGAEVRAFALGNGAIGPQLAIAMTDAQGRFTISIGDYAGPLMLQMSGGSYIDEATGLRMSMGAGDVMTAVIPTVAAGSTVSGIGVTPLTAMAQAMAAHMAGGLTEANIAAANSAVGNYFRIGDILQTPPVNPLVSGSGTGASLSMLHYGMTLAAMSQYAKNAGMPNSSAFVTAMMNDASDGVLDGKAGSAPVMMGSGMMGGGMMHADAGRTGLATAMVDFMESNFNRSGVSAIVLAALMEQLRDSVGQLR